MEVKIKEIPINFIIGYVRTGSTLLMALLREHPDIETDVQEPNWLYRLLNTEYRYDFHEKLLGMSGHDSMEMYFDSVKLMTQYYFDRLCRVTGKSVVVIKHPYLSIRVNFLNRMFWKGKFIHILRHPYDALASAYHFTKLHWEAESALGNGMEAIIKNYQDWMIRLCNAEGNLVPRNMRIKYEHLIENPHAVLADCFNHLGVVWTDKLVDEIIAKAQENKLSLVGGPLHSSVICKPGELFNTILNDSQRELVRKKTKYFLELLDYGEKY